MFAAKSMLIIPIHIIMATYLHTTARQLAYWWLKQTIVAELIAIAMKKWSCHVDDYSYTNRVIHTGIYNYIASS